MKVTNTELPQEFKDYLEKLKTIPNAINNFVSVANDLISGKLRLENVIDADTNEVIGGILIKNHE